MSINNKKKRNEVKIGSQISKLRINYFGEWQNLKENRF